MTIPRPHPGWVVAGLLTLLLGAAVLGDNGVLQLRRLRAEVESLHRDVQALEAENERLSRAIAELRHDPTALERIAREELGLVRPGERVLRFPRSPEPPRSP
ncbi:MAG TPA: septum formation initiator family protein [Methylomirabilota bacterium]|jgi:cell division protein FtsB|nr:septum formation initiator family protein [Methylomirabilota bacterium]